jgi:hypothetical protein
LFIFASQTPLTMFILRTTDYEKIEAVIEPASLKSINAILKDKRFEFDWQEEYGNEVLLLKMRESGKIMGLISLVDIPEEIRIELRLIEISSENIGREKEYDHIPGCLIAFACKMAFDKGYFGFVSLTPKTKLIALYTNKYGFEQYGRQLASNPDNSRKLIKKYLGHEFI